tara:strand:- start:1544 stop:2686 length:1143 start_codon:yes stop_codon:yes gene_type:complete
LRKWALGGFLFSLQGEGEVYNYLVAEFSHLPDAHHNPNCHLAIRLVQYLPAPPVGATITKEYIGWKCGYQKLTDNLKYQYTESEEAPELLLDIATYKKNPYLLRRVFQFFDSNYLTDAQLHAKNFMYGCFNLVSAILISRMQIGCYFHASSFEKNGYGVALVAAGGVGKTTSMMRLVAHHGWRYLSDDIALVGSRGELIRTPLRMQVYGYNVKGDNELRKKLLNERSLLDLISWNLRIFRKGPFRTRRRIHAEEIFGSPSVSDRAHCAAIIFMERAQISDFVVKRIENSELISKLMHIMPNEIGDLDSTSDGLSLVHCELPGFSRVDYERLSETFLKTTIGDIPIYIFRIPASSSPDELTENVARFLDQYVSLPPVATGS